MSFAADDYEAIRRRAEEIKAERNLALTGSTLEEPKAAGHEGYGEYAMGYTLKPGDLHPSYMGVDYDPA
jgi:hypothetical protein